MKEDNFSHEDTIWNNVSFLQTEECKTEQVLKSRNTLRYIKRRDEYLSKNTWVPR